MTEDGDGRIALVERLADAIADEVARLDPTASIGWDVLPDVRAMVLHVGGVQRWVTTVLRSGRGTRMPEPGEVDDLADWYRDGAEALLAALREVPADTPCWVLGGPDRTAAFWRRRMVLELGKHLADLRAAGGAPWRTVPELRADDCADGVDELLEVFVPRARTALPALPGAVELVADDLPRRWRIGADWSTGGGEDPAARVHASAAELLLLLWERADPFDAARFRLEGDRAAVAALAAARVHGW
ncbi:maleylpyruvate isomerase N-terminal domain-containing protein [Amnibacterium endophyticum]|uniref:Maleylpyruvate isomerase N-terminal domain-containing protein n=1 Tax=Amnibacterium endophyticum TaxID=2109337 RepID=A0ABW4LE27_9MICO